MFVLLSDIFIVCQINKNLSGPFGTCEMC